MPDVLIAGGGIAGLACRLALSHQGITSSLVERRTTAADGGLAINLPGNAVSALMRLGLGDGLMRLGTPIRRREYRTDTGKLLFQVDEEAFWGREARSRCVRRSDLIRLLSGPDATSGIVHGMSLVSVDQFADRVDVALSDGATLSASLLIGADGVHSAVRRSIDGGPVPSAALLAKASWRFMAPNPGVEHWTLWTGRDCMVLLLPVDRDEVYGWISTRGAGAPDELVDIVAAALKTFPKTVRQTVEAACARPGAVYHSPLEEVRIPRWSNGRIVLVGDAAHATAPVWAQGAALAIEDAEVLATLLPQLRDWRGIGPIFDRRRRPRVEHVGDMTDRISRAARLPHGIMKAIMPFVGPRSYKATYAPLRDLP